MAPPAFPADLDVVIHCAATVAFDPPIDEGFQTNLLGTVQLYEAVRDSGSRAAPRPRLHRLRGGDHEGDRPGGHAGAPSRLANGGGSRAPGARRRRGRVATTRAARSIHGGRSRKQHSRAGPQTVAADAEQRRKDWVTKRLDPVRASALPDARGGRTTTPSRRPWVSGRQEELAAASGLPLSIVRPSIIESAYVHPYPGWIEGFKMAEPIILAYGGRHDPRVPRAFRRASSTSSPPTWSSTRSSRSRRRPPPMRPRPGYYHVSSGGQEPAPMYHELYEYVREYFEKRPASGTRARRREGPEWTFPGTLRVERLLRTGERLVERRGQGRARASRSRRSMRELVARVDRDKDAIDFIRRYSDLYGTYTEAEVIYTDDRTLGLFRVAVRIRIVRASRSIAPSWTGSTTCRTCTVPPSRRASARCRPPACPRRSASASGSS